MSETTSNQVQKIDNTRCVPGGAWALATTAASFAIGAWALAEASGVTHLSGSDYETEFIHPTISALAFLGLAGVVGAARHRLWAGLAATAGLVAGQTWAMTVCVQRYADSGWGDGLEVLGYVQPALLGVLGLLGTVLTRGVVRARRE